MRAIRGLRSKTGGALSVTAVAAVIAGGAPAAARAAQLKTAIRLPVASRVEILAADRVRVRVKARRRMRVRLTPLVVTADAAPKPLGRTRSRALKARRWTTIALPLSESGRAALAACPAGDLAVRARATRSRRRRSAAVPLVLEPPDCSRFFGPGAIWNAALAPDAPLDPDSASVTANLRAMVDAGYRSRMPPTINTTAYAPSVDTVAADERRVPVQLDSASDLGPALASVPLPRDARPAPGTDGELVVWQPATDTMWEFWRLRREPDGWHASWGGRLDDVSGGPGHFAAPHAGWGTSASSLALAGGMITPRELRLGNVDHALSLGIPRARAGVFALPAQRTDGISGCREGVPEGAHFRLDSAVDVDSLGLPAAVATLAHAAQRYGIFVRDQSDAVAFYAQSTVSLPQDPYPAMFGGVPAYELLKSFPWAHLQLLRMDVRSERGQQPLPLLPTCP